MIFWPLTGAAVNPARWFGPALVSGEFADAWVYVLAPLVGAALAFGGDGFPPHDPGKGHDRARGRVADTLRHHRLIETETRRIPAQYLWLHKRFKGLSPDYPDPYAR